MRDGCAWIRSGSAAAAAEAVDFRPAVRICDGHARESSCMAHSAAYCWQHCLSSRQPRIQLQYYPGGYPFNIGLYRRAGEHRCGNANGKVVAAQPSPVIAIYFTYYRQRFAMLRAVWEASR